jgi:ribosomal protein L11 methyltransferase
MRDVAPGGVTVEEPVDILGPEKGFRVRENEPVLVRVYLPASELGAVLTEDLRRAMEAFPQVELIAKPLYEQDWAVSWREFFGVVDHGGRTLIVPSWIDHEPRPDQLVIRLDPGRRSAPVTTKPRALLAALEEHVTPGMEVLDVGTGSGVLAIAAVLLGAGHGHAIDIDPIATEVATANCETNGVLPKVAIRAGVLGADHGHEYGLVIANISTDANLGLAGVFPAVVAPGLAHPQRHPRAGRPPRSGRDARTGSLEAMRSRTGAC